MWSSFWNRRGFPSTRSGRIGVSDSATLKCLSGHMKQPVARLLMSLLPRRRKWGWAIRIAGYTVVLDACVLYPAPLRDFLLELAGSGIFRARWTEAIHDEWIRNLSEA